MRIVRTDPFTGKTNEMDIPITLDQLERWQNGTLIQIAMPDISADQREFIKTGITQSSWDSMFGQPETSDTEIGNNER